MVSPWAQCAISGCTGDAWHVAIGLRGSPIGVDSEKTHKTMRRLGIHGDFIEFYIFWRFMVV
jgi:hypothetical protein